ncbi:MAG: hypothetical protein GY790_01230 [Bacteroidetes bacterium]|nr:hypothetical protein [Bacteroidota bacterium]
MKTRATIAALFFLILAGGCDGLTGPDLKGEITLSSQLHGTDSYYLFGYSFENSEMYKYPFPGMPFPDIINEGFSVFDVSGQASLPGFNTPDRVNGFAVVGEFSSLDDAREFYQAYSMVEEGLQFEIVSDTVELYQVWVQKTSAGNYVKMLIKEIYQPNLETGSPYSEVTFEYYYSNDGSAEFSGASD